MADEYKGLYVKFRGDATELTKALRQIRSETRQADRQLSDINKALKFDSKSVELLAERMKSAEKAAQSQAREVDTLKEAQKELGERTDENAEAYDRLSREVAIAEAKLKEAQKQVVKATEAHTELGQKSAAWAELSTKAENAAKKVSKASDAIGEAGRSLTKGVTVPILAVATASAAAAIEIDTAWYDVRKTVDATEEEYRQLKDAAIELSKTEPIKASQILETEALGAQLGVAKQDLQDFAMTVSELDIATNLSSEEAATQIAQFANITKQAWQEAYTATEYYEKLASVVVHLGNNTATTESDIMNMSTRFASSATMAGFTTAEIMGVSTALASTGMNAEAAGSALSTSVLLASKAVETAGMSLEEYQDSIHRWDKTSEKSYTTQQQHLMTLAEVSGKTVEQFAADWKENAPEAFVDLIVKMGQVQDEAGDLATKLDAMGLGSIRTSDAMRRLAGNSENLTGIIEMANEAWDDGTYAQQEYEQRSQSLASQIEVLKNRVTAIAEDVGGPLVNAVLNVIDQCEPLIHVVEDAAQAFNDMSEEEQQATLKNVALVAAIGPLLSIVGKLGNGFSTIVSGVGKLWGAYSKATGAINSFLVAAKASNDQLVGGEINADKTSQKLGLLFNKYTAAAGGADQYYEALKSLRTAKEDQAAIDAKIDQNEQAVAKSMQLRKSAASEAVAAQREMSDASKDAAAASGAEKAAHEKVQAAVDAEKAAKEALRQAESDLDGQKVKVAEAATEKEASLRRQNVANAKVEQAELQAVVNERKRDLNEATAAVKEAKAEEDAASKAVVKAEQRKTDATKKYTTSKKKYLDTTAAVAKNEEDHIELQERLAAAEKETAAATAACNEVQQKSTGIMGRLRTAGNVLKGALTGVVGVAKTLWKTLWPMAVITAGIAIVQKVIDYFQELKKQAEDYKLATTGLKDAVSNCAVTIRDSADAPVTMAENITTLKDKLDEAATSQADLAREIQNAGDSYSTSNAMLDNAVAVIDNYSGKAGLTTVELGKLRAAVQYVNDELGTNYDLLDDNTVAYEENGEAVKLNTDELYRNADARKVQAQTKAMTDELEKLNEQQVANTKNLGEAKRVQSEANKELQDYAATLPKLADGTIDWNKATWEQKTTYNELDRNLNWANQNLEKANALYDENAGAIQLLEGNLGLLNGSLSDSATNWDALKGSMFLAAQSVGMSTTELNGLVNHLHAAGYSVSDLRKLSDTEWQGLMLAFKNGTMSIPEYLATCTEHGQEILDNAGNNWNDSFSSTTANLVASAAEAAGLTVKEFGEIADGAGISGDEAVQALANALLENPEDQQAAVAKAKLVMAALASGIEADSGQVGAAMEAVQALIDEGGDWDAVLSALSENGVKVPQEVADSIEQNSGSAEEAVNTLLSLVSLTAENYDFSDATGTAGENLMNGVVEGVKANSGHIDAITTAFNEIGKAADEGTAQGIDDNQGAIDDALAKSATATEQAGRDALQVNSPSKIFEEIGKGIPEGTALGITENQTVLDSALVGMADYIKAKAQVFSEVGQSIAQTLGQALGSQDYSAAGAAVGSGLASGISNSAGAVQSAAASLGTSAQSGLSKAPAQAKPSGKATGVSYALGITGTATNSKTGGTLLGTNVVSGMDTAKTKAKSSGAASGSNFASGISSKSSVVSAAGRVLANSTSTLNSRAGSATTWGQHLGGNFAAGISSKYGAVVAAANSLASAASSVLKFSVPKEGPWSGAERGGYTSGRHLVENIASGMYAAIPEMERAARAVGQAMEPPAYADRWAASYTADLAREARSNSLSGTVGGATYNIRIDGMSVNDDKAMQAAARKFVTNLVRTGGM